MALAVVASACGETTISIETSHTEPGLENDLLLYLPFDEADAGQLALDASGNEHHGTPSASPPTPSESSPPVGFPNPRSLAFDGVAQLIDLGNPAGLDVSGPFTLAAWIRPTELSGYRNIVAHGFRLMPNAEVSLRIYNGAFQFTAWDSVDHMATAPVPAGDLDNWHHVAGVYDGTAYRLYRDGELIDEHLDSFVPPQVEAPWGIGGRSTATPPEDRYFAGLIDEVRIYGRALSNDELRALFRR